MKRLPVLVFYTEKPIPNSLIATIKKDLRGYYIIVIDGQENQRVELLGAKTKTQVLKVEKELKRILNEQII